ncbi:LysR family transcriptional regulator [Paratractidigestivibacter sp.]|uniref:LysR family transcriptional regulator n=1 Tax=Paratractidigestivibacter sp. TaxID=2847316 RepID=UPI002AC9EB9C|nr:LysR family transcriptional regulator [Paratractidigestivibacter sp.]
MYDRRLDAIVAAAELGSFTRAAERLRISTTALVKQVTTFEGEFGVTLFARSHTGVSPTAAGELLVSDARQIIGLSEAALRRARGQGAPVRLGVSLMCPGKNTQALWPKIHEIAPDLQLEVVTIGDLYDSRTTVMARLGEQVDVVQSSYSTVRWGGLCQLLPIFSTPFSVDVLRSSELAGQGKVTLDDLRGMRIRMLRHANDATDQLRQVLKREHGIEVADAQSFDFALFNDAAEHGDAVVTSGAWSGVHPGFVGVTLDYPLEVPCFLAYPRDPAPHIQRFVDAMAQVLDDTRGA